MKPPPFSYARPETLDEVVSLLAAHGGEGKVIAGGQSLLPMLNMRLIRPAVLIDLALVDELQVLTREAGELVIGAGVRQRVAETSPTVRQGCVLMPLALRYVGHVQIRNRGTVGGSLAHADPAAELPGVALALDASLVTVSPRGRRTIAARDFFLGPYTTALDEDEVLVEMRLPVATKTRCAFLEVARRSRDPALAGVAAAVRFGEGGMVAEAHLAAIGVGATPFRLLAAEDAARGGSLGPTERARIASAAIEDAERASRTSPDSDYRRRLVGTLVSRTLAEVAA